MDLERKRRRQNAWKKAKRRGPRGGEYSEENLVLSCIGCNARHGGQVNGGGRVKPASTEDEVL